MSSIKVGVMIRFAKNSSNDCLGIDPGSDFIQQLFKRTDGLGSLQASWENRPVAKALKGSSIAASSFAPALEPLHVFYQDPELHVRDHYVIFRKQAAEWTLGEQILALSSSMNESSLDCRFARLWHTTTWNAHHGRNSPW